MNIELMSVDHRGILKAIYCPNCVFVHIMQKKKACTVPNCTCENPITFDSMLDLFGNFYYHLDNINLSDYNTLTQDDGGAISEKKRREIREIWKTHVSSLEYDTNTEDHLDSTTHELIEIHLGKTESPSNLLQCMYNWLIILDQHLTNYKQFVEKTAIDTFPKKVRRGEVILKRTAPITNFLKGNFEGGLLPPIDPNYLTMRAFVNNFHLVKSRYSYYNVEHKKLFPFQPEKFISIEDLKIGFISGDVNFEEMVWNIESETADEKYFSFSGHVDTQLHQETIEQYVKEVLANNPEFIILPEFLTPLSLQDRIGDVLREQYNSFAQRLELEKHNTLLLMPGSFHSTAEDLGLNCDNPRRIYNYSNVMDLKGDGLINVFKMNRYRFNKQIDFEGALSGFKTHDGVEQNAYDQRNIVLLETPLGRIGVFICVDLLNHNIEEILIDRHVDIVFIMALTEKPASGKFLRRMQELGERNSSMMVICNNLGSFNGERIVVYFPGIKEPFTSREVFKVYTLGQMMNEAYRKSKDRLVAAGT